MYRLKIIDNSSGNEA